MSNSKMQGNGLIAGLLLGISIGLLFAPKKGSESREDITRLSKNVADKSKRLFGNIEKKADKVTRNVNSEIEYLQQRIAEGDEEAGVELYRLLKHLEEALNNSDD